MKHLIKVISTFGLILISHSVYADDITDTYANGDTLTVTTLNNIKSAVNSKQDDVSGACPAGEAIRAINADGTVECEAVTNTDTLGSLICAVNEHVKWDGDAWICAGVVTRGIPISIYGVNLFRGANIDAGGLLLLPKADDDPGLRTVVSVPHDYQPGTDIRFLVMFRSESDPPLGGVVSFSAGATALEAGKDRFGTSQPVEVLPLGFTATEINRVLITVSGLNGALQPNGALFLGLFRDTNGLVDTHLGDVSVMSVHGLYTAIE